MFALVDCRLISKDAWYFIRLSREVLSQDEVLPALEDRLQVQSAAAKFSCFSLEVIVSEAERKALWRLLAGAADLAQMAYRHKKWSTLGLSGDPSAELARLKQRAEWIPVHEPKVSVA